MENKCLNHKVLCSSGSWLIGLDFHLFHDRTLNTDLCYRQQQGLLLGVFWLLLVFLLDITKILLKTRVIHWFKIWISCYLEEIYLLRLRWLHRANIKCFCVSMPFFLFVRPCFKHVFSQIWSAIQSKWILISIVESRASKEGIWHSRIQSRIQTKYSMSCRCRQMMRHCTLVSKSITRRLIFG